MILERVRRGERIEHYETVRQRKDGSLLDISLTVSPIKNEKGEVVGASKIARDITELKRAQERQELLLREMDHRVKNLFALAISVLSLSGRTAASVPELIGSARDRLLALSRAHALTLSHGSRDVPQAAKPATLHSLIQAIAAPHDVHGDSDASKFSVSGCDMEISGPVISSLALLLHEFATNSTKYGALSATAGRIQIHCANHGEDPPRYLDGARRTRSRASNGQQRVRRSAGSHHNCRPWWRTLPGLAARGPGHPTLDTARTPDRLKRTTG